MGEPRLHNYTAYLGTLLGNSYFLDPVKVDLVSALLLDGELTSRLQGQSVMRTHPNMIRFAYVLARQTNTH